MVYICSKKLQLIVGSHELSQAVKKLAKISNFTKSRLFLPKMVLGEKVFNFE